MAPLTHFFISKNRKVDFEVALIIHDLINVPLVSGLYYVQWKIKYASHPSGSTARSPIKDHCVYWNHPISTMTHLIISKQRLLGACELKLEVYQELGGGKETTSIGNLTVNLSAYAEKGVTSDRYLLHDSKFNSTIKLTIRMNQKSDVGIQFQVPPLMKKQTFKDIPTIVTERKLRTCAIDDQRSTALTTCSSIRKSNSVMSLAKYCRQSAISWKPIDDTSAADLVEQLFANKPTDIQA